MSGDFIPDEFDTSRALALDRLTRRKGSLNVVDKSYPYIRAGFLLFGNRIDDLVGVPEGLERPIFDPMSKHLELFFQEYEDETASVGGRLLKIVGDVLKASYQQPSHRGFTSVFDPIRKRRTREARVQE